MAPSTASPTLTSRRVVPPPKVPRPEPSATRPAEESTKPGPSNGVAGVVFVVGAEMTPRRTAQNALEQLAGARAKVIGAVLNRVDVHRHSYYYAQYYRKDYTRAYIRTP